jgi:hypothetical protein
VADSVLRTLERANRDGGPQALMPELVTLLTAKEPV